MNPTIIAVTILQRVNDVVSSGGGGTPTNALETDLPQEQILETDDLEILTTD